MKYNFGKILKKAYDEHYAIPAFNVDNYEMMAAIVKTAEKMHSPVILMFTSSAIKYYGLENLITVGHNLQTKAQVPVILHLDHQPDLQICKTAIDLGIDSVMYDGSHLAFADNLRNCQSLKQYANQREVLFEAELGQIAGAEDWKTNNQVIYTDPEEYCAFLDQCPVDWMAVAIGTVHGQYHGIPNLNFDLLKTLHGLRQQVLVLHGGSGLPANQIQKGFLYGIGKVNFGTEIKQAFARGCLEYSVLVNQELTDVRAMLQMGMQWICDIVEAKIEICQSAGRA